MRVNFLVKKNKFHYWLQAPDGANVTPKFIVCQNLLVEHLGWKYKVAEEEKINRLFQGFSKKNTFNLYVCSQSHCDQSYLDLRFATVIQNEHLQEIFHWIHWPPYRLLAISHFDILYYNKCIVFWK